MTNWSITRGSDLILEPAGSDGLADGLAVGVLAGSAQGSVHLEIAVSELAPGGEVAGHLHPFEESFYVLAGSGLVRIGDLSYRLLPDDFGFVPLAVAHAWSNDGAEPLRLLRMRAPQPRAVGEVRGTYRTDAVGIPTDGRPIEGQDPSARFVGHFDETRLPPPGPLSMRGYRGANVDNVSLWMLVDDLLGAVHHSMFVVEFQPVPDAARVGGDHFHPFEEAYYFVRGRATGFFEGEERDVRTGDLVWVGTNAFHGYANTFEEPVRWIEVQAPAPPPSGAFFFRTDWAGL